MRRFFVSCRAAPWCVPEIGNDDRYGFQGVDQGPALQSRNRDHHIAGIIAGRNVGKLLALALGVLLVGPAPALQAAAGKVTDIHLGTIVPSGTPQHVALKEMTQQWQKAAGGTVRVIIHADGVLGGEAEMVQKMRIGQLKACVLSGVGLSVIDQAVAGLQMLPMAFRSWEEVDHVREKMRPMLEKRLRAKGYEVLFWADAGWVRFFSKAPVVHPESLRKMKIFVWAGDVPQTEIMKSMGYRPIGLETTDIVLGLNTDMVNVVPMPPLFALAGQLYKTASHMLDLNWAPIVGATVIRTEVWNQLPEATQQAWRAAAEATGAKVRARARSETDDAVQVMKQRGLTVHALTPEVAAEWQALAEQVYPKLRGTMVPAEVFDEVLRYLGEYRANAKAGGR